MIVVDMWACLYLTRKCVIFQLMSLGVSVPLPTEEALLPAAPSGAEGVQCSEKAKPTVQFVDKVRPGPQGVQSSEKAPPALQFGDKVTLVSKHKRLNGKSAVVKALKGKGKARVDIDGKIATIDVACLQLLSLAPGEAPPEGQPSGFASVTNTEAEEDPAAKRARLAAEILGQMDESDDS